MGGHRFVSDTANLRQTSHRAMGCPVLNRCEKAQFWIYLISLIIFVPTLVLFPTKGGYVGYGLQLGLFIGTTIEHRFINFSTDVSFKKKIIRILIGILTVLILKSGIKMLLLCFYQEEEIPYFFDLIRYFLITLFATGVIPFLFKSEHNAKGI